RIELDKLPIEAEPALTADEVKLPAAQGSAATMLTRSAQANRRAEKVIRVFERRQWLAPSVAQPTAKTEWARPLRVCTWRSGTAPSRCSRERGALLKQRDSRLGKDGPVNGHIEFHFTEE